MWQDHGLGLLRTIVARAGILSRILSIRNFRTWKCLAKRMAGFHILILNVRSYTYPMAQKAATLFKKVNPDGIVLAGGIHSSVALDEMIGVEAFDRICQGPGERIIVNLIQDPLAFDRVIQGKGEKSMADWPVIHRHLWPKLSWNSPMKKQCWPLEPSCGWGPEPVVTVLTSRVCPWKCAFCNENSFIPVMRRRPVDSVIDEINQLDATTGPVGSVVIHDSMFMQNPGWLQEWVDKYPRKTRNPWPYWAATRTDVIRRWPEIFSDLVTETEWQTISIGFESGSDRVLKTLNKECTLEDHLFAIDLIRRIGDDLESRGKARPGIWANFMLGAPGETREDAFQTMKLMNSIPGVIPSVSYYAPYPGSALGYQLIAEGKSLMSKTDYHRFPSTRKLKGVDYEFYGDLLKGRYESEIEAVRL
jgi:radical SAM superfamily enzyme YgiQ (UPF0313 family)